MTILWIGILAMGLVGVVLLVKSREQPPRCPGCKVLTEPVPGGVFQEYPPVIEMAYQCPRCARMVFSFYVDDLLG